MLLVVECLLALASPQFEVQPIPGVVGQVMVVRHRAGAAGVPLAVELPGGEVRPCGVTSPAGAIEFTPATAGQHVFIATVAGVRSLVPVAVVPARQRWPLALASVPLGLALLWWNLGAARRRACSPAARS